MVERLEGKYFPWVLICSSDQNNVGWITFFLFSLDIALLSKVSGESEKVTKEKTQLQEETTLQKNIS